MPNKPIHPKRKKPSKQKIKTYLKNHGHSKDTLDEYDDFDEVTDMIDIIAEVHKVSPSELRRMLNA